MTTVVTNTVITIDLKEYARLQAIEEAARKAIEDCVFYDPLCLYCMSEPDQDGVFMETHDRTCLVHQLTALVGKK